MNLSIIISSLIVFAFKTLDSVKAQVADTAGGINVVVDLSHWNPNVNFTKAKADGILGVIHKATQGISYVDPDYVRREPQAKQAGIKWGAYHFADGRPGVEQAKHYLKIIGDNPDTLLALDIEENPGGTSTNLSISEDFVRTVYEARGRYPLVYGSAFLKNLVKGTNSVLLDCPLWIAQWGPKPIIPENTWSHWTLWQYTDGQNGPEPHAVDGIGHCDRDTVNDALYSSLEDMWSTTGYNNQPQASTAAPTSQEPRCTSTPRPTGRSTTYRTTPRT